MTTRRTFLAGLLASAATGAAQPVPAQPVAVFPFTTAGWANTGRGFVWFSKTEPRLVRWADPSDSTTWVPA